LDRARETAARRAEDRPRWWHLVDDRARGVARPRGRGDADGREKFVSSNATRRVVNGGRGRRRGGVLRVVDEREKGSVFGRHTARDGGDERGDDARTSGRDGGGGFLERFGACARGEDGGGDGGM